MWREIESVEDLKTLLSPSASDRKYHLILKHSTRCSISSMAKGRIEKNTDDRIDYYMINVLTHRNVSDALSEHTGVQHESPQAFLFHDTSLLDVKSHSAIRPQEFSEQVDQAIQS